MKQITFDGGTLLAANDDNLELTYALVPHGEQARSNLGVFETEQGSFEIPTDFTGMSVNLDHKREHPVASIVMLDDQPDTLVARFRFAQTEAGLAAYLDAKDPNGKRRHVSVEAADVKIKNGKAVGGRVFGAGLVDEPAFPSATLLASAVDTDEEQEQHETPAGTAPDENTTTDPVAAEQPAPADANEEEPDMGLPNTLTAGKAPVATTAPRPLELRSLFAALNRAKVRMATTEDMTLLASSSSMLGAGSPEQIASTLLAALTDITISGSGSLPVGGAAIQPNWVGQLNQGVTYERIYVPLAKTGTEITAEGKKGYKVRRGTVGAPVDVYGMAGDWTGNKAAIASGSGFTEPYTSELHRFAFGNDVAREYFDLPGGEAVLAAYFGLIKEDHLIWSDEYARRAWIELAGVPLTPATYPTDYPGALGVVMQAIRGVAKPKADKRRDKASFVIVNDYAAEQLDYTPFEHVPEFIKFSWNLDRSDLKAGDVVLVNGDIGIDATAAALAGASYALELDELPGGPLWIDALEIAKGGVDRALHGYLQEFQVRPEAVKLVGTPDTLPLSTAVTVGDIVKVSSVFYRVTVAGTTAGSNPSAPAVGATVASGGATLLRLV